ncbi:ammonium transporter family-domain-containing protein [Lentinula boryana]|uniref:Ammonium transporter family-domain-containing protein n=1 Tax=Lentinula boryana TaxID=40481 RepID=A0ABQ8PYT4_9AGAR|nr:ammonium transporter family-domain-containing protein [Lentinula boryana]
MEPFELVFECEFNKMPSRWRLCIGIVELQLGDPTCTLFVGFTAIQSFELVFMLNETLEVIFASHAVGGIVGNVLTGLFAQASVANFDGITTIPGGWLDHNYIQLGYQLADSIAALSYSFVMTTIILWIMHFIPFLKMRGNEEGEMEGLDEYDMGEFAYDYVGMEREIGNGDEFDSEGKGREGMTSGGREPHHEHHHLHHVDENSLEKGQ